MGTMILSYTIYPAANLVRCATYRILILGNYLHDVLEKNASDGKFV